ncbi:hypothetical protein [Allonocardiopsis opalescens]|uniref:Uncharacterized protein n=1 Tax=Allonocardiopsis opalescens TaxID=1144618 RepID=A0A2T0Q724_9ACTN|nr:hypothetical protein [Allonocardiopsis opalescens]PRX99636.1 hypothetical protein CLV72_103240 [Allonocardiopsis opalescens]
MIVRWCVPGAAVQWEWPAEGRRYRVGARVVRPDGRTGMESAETHTAAGPPDGLLGDRPGTAFRELTALFAQEANVPPGAVAITWIADGTAVTWDRTTGAWTRHPVSRDPDGTVWVGPPAPLPEPAGTPSVTDALVHARGFLSG